VATGNRIVPKRRQAERSDAGIGAGLSYNVRAGTSLVECYGVAEAGAGAVAEAGGAAAAAGCGAGVGWTTVAGLAVISAWCCSLRCM